MMNVDDVLRSVASAHSPDEEVRACFESITAGATPLAGALGDLSALDAHRIFALRRESLQNAGIPLVGFAATLASLCNLPPDEPVTLAAFRDLHDQFTVFLSGSTGQALGCVRVPLRDREPGPGL